jgi:hypothetical protein
VDVQRKHPLIRVLVDSCAPLVILSVAKDLGWE